MNNDLKSALTAAPALIGSSLLLIGHMRLGAGLWALAYLALLLQTVPRLVNGTGRRAFGVQPTTRIILSFGATGPLIHEELLSEWLAWAMIMVTIFIARSEGLLRRAAFYTGLRVSAIPGLEIRAPQRMVVPTYVSIQLLALPVAVVLGLVQARGLSWVLPTALVGATAIMVVWEALRQRQWSRDAFDRLPQVLSQFQPKFVIYWDAPRNSQFQLGMWLPYLRQLDVPFFVIVRNPRSFTQASEVAEDVPMVLCRSMAEVERVCIDSLTAAFYVNNAARNSHFVRFGALTHVQLLHGDSDKAPSYNPVTAMFDKIFVAGQAGMDRYANHGVEIPAERFEIVGRPQVVGIEGPRTNTIDLSDATVLYAPTWKGYHEDAAYSSMGSAHDIVQSIIACGSRVVFRPHPYSYREPEFRRIIREVQATLEADTASSGREHLFGSIAEEEMSIQDCFNAADIMIADVSSVVADFLYSQKPFLIVTDEADQEQFIDDFPLASAAYVVDADPAAIKRALQEIGADDRLADARREKRAYYLGDFPAESYEQVFLDAAAAVLEPTHSPT